MKLKRNITQLHITKSIHYTKSPKRGEMGRIRCPVARRRPFVDGAGFKDSRILAGLDRHAAAQLLGVTVRTVQNWEMSRCRVPDAAFKLMRQLRGELLGAWTAGDSVERHCTVAYFRDGAPV